MTDTSSAWIERRVDDLDKKVDTLSSKVDRLPTREELAASDGNKMDRSSYNIAHQALEQTVAQVAQAQQATASGLQRQSEYVQQQLLDGQKLRMEAQKQRQDLEATVHQVCDDVNELKQKPATFQRSMSFWLLVLGTCVALISALCANSMALVELILRLQTGH